MTTKGTLLYVINGSRILLIKKKRGLGAGKWNGPGGRVEKGETPQEAAVREVEEETGITPENVEKLGELEFYYGQEEKTDWEVHVFVATSFTGKERETSEAKPGWLPVGKIPYRKMWPDDIHWMPLMLSGKKFAGKFYYDKSENLLRHEVREA